MVRSELLKTLGMVAYFVICLIGAIAYSNWWFNTETAIFDLDGGYSYSVIPYFRFVFPLFIVSSLFLLLFTVVNMTVRSRRDVTYGLFLWPIFHLFYYHPLPHGQFIVKWLSLFWGKDNLNALTMVIYMLPFFFPVDVILGALISIIVSVILLIRKHYNNNEAMIKKLNWEIGIAFAAFIFNLLWALNIISYSTFIFSDAIAQS